MAFAALSQKSASVTVTKHVGAKQVITEQAITDVSAPTENTVKKSEASSDALRKIYHRLKEDELLQKNIDGVSLKYQENSVFIRMVSDELYESGVYSMRETWLPILDHFAEILKPEQTKGLVIKIHTYTDQEQPREVKSGDFGASDLTLSALRGEWVARYLQRQHNFILQEKIILESHGAILKGKRLDLELSY